MAYRYTAEEALELIMNDELAEMESCDSFDSDDFSNDITSSCSELDSDPDQDFCGRTISVATVPNLDSQPRGCACTRGGNTRSTRKRIQTRGGYRSLPSIKRLDSVGLDNDTIREDSENNDWKEDPPNIKIFIFNETPGLNLAVSENALPMFFFNLLLTDDVLNTLLQKTNEYADRIINKVRPLRRRSYGAIGKMSILMR